MARMWYAVMIQHNDSDTSCMRVASWVPAERTFASETEHTYHPYMSEAMHCCHVWMWPLQVFVEGS